MPTLITERLLMEPFNEEHSSGMFELWSSPEVCKYSGSASDIASNLITLPAQGAKDSDKILNFFIQYQQLSIGFRWAILSKNNKQFLGAMGFNSLGECSEIAYHLIPRYWGQGFMIEACREAMNWITSSYGSTSVEAFIEPENILSVKLIQKLNFKATGESSDGAGRYLYNIKS